MIKLKTNKSNTIQFDIDIKNSGDAIQGHFRLIHENVEYGFPVHILGNRNKAQVKIPVLEKVIPGLNKNSNISAKLEFVDGTDYLLAWDDDVEIDIPRISVNVEEKSVKVSEEDDHEEIVSKKAKVTEVSADIDNNFSVSDKAWEDAKKNPKKSLI